jgi:general secretion pathway protein I
MINRTSCGKRRGLTLLEVIVAMTIFMASGILIYQLVSLGNDRALDVQLHSRASMLCQSKLEELKIGAEPLTGTSGQAFSNDDSDFQYDVNVEDGDLQGIKKVRVTVKQERDGRVLAEVSLSQLILDPTMRGSTLDKLTGSSSTSTSGGTSR